VVLKFYYQSTAIDFFLLNSLVIFIAAGTYYRFKMATDIFGLKINAMILFRTNSTCYFYGQFIPGFVAIDAMRIFSLRHFDGSRYKHQLVSASLLEKVVALCSQVVNLFAFFIVYSGSGIVLITFLACSLFLIVVFIVLKKNLFSKHKKWLSSFLTPQCNFSNLMKIFCFSGFLNLVSLFGIVVIYLIVGGHVDAQISLLAVSFFLANLVAVIPLTPNGIGVSELSFGYLNKAQGMDFSIGFYSGIFLTFRFLSIWSHLFLYILTSFFVKDEIEMNEK
jgi:uncharacterized membrane protein YbhN (UPF0104 family)